MTQKEIGPFIGEQKPVNVGVYKRKVPSVSIKVWSLWNGKKWMAYCHTYAKAAKETGVSSFQNSPWWGIEK